MKNQLIDANHRKDKKFEIEILFWPLEFFYGLALLSNAPSDGPHHYKTNGYEFETRIHHGYMMKT